MEYNQFRQLLQLKGIREKETVSLLEDFIERFPYCQTSRLLLAKALHEQNSIHYDRSVKLAAAYAPNREILRNLIEKRSDETEYEFPLQKKESEVEPSVTFSSEEKISAAKKEERFEQWYSEEEISGRAFIEQKENEKHVDPHELIRQRLNEILSENISQSPSDTAKVEPEQKHADVAPLPEVSIPVSQETPVETVSIPEEEVNESVTTEEVKQQEEEKKPVQEFPVGSRDEKKIIAEVGNAKDILDRMELEHAMEESILDSLEKLPVIAPEKNFGEAFTKKSGTENQVEEKEISDSQSPRSFTDWLKIVKPLTPGFEEVRAPSTKPMSVKEEVPFEEAQEPESHLSDDELIEKFLLEDPKIGPSKAEFYSPVNQAKKSVMDHEDVVSETLAKIFLKQGNTRKARWSYEKLILLYPEKSAFFAALLKEIDDQSNNKEDL
jgi:hypothetical protein